MTVATRSTKVLPAMLSNENHGSFASLGIVLQGFPEVSCFCVLIHRLSSCGQKYMQVAMYLCESRVVSGSDT